MIQKMMDDIPPYPYGPNHLYKQSNFGLYGGARVRFGNNVADSEFKTKTRRRWHPNVQRHRFYSEALETSIQMKVTTRVMRTIDKVGGLDNYLLGEKPARIKVLGPKGWLLRWKLMQTPAIKEKWEKMRVEYGLSLTEPAERQELREEWEGELASRPTKEEKAERFKRFNERPDIWRKMYGPLLEMNQLVDKSQQVIEGLEASLNMVLRIFRQGTTLL
jgi:large subunit ribosomal protein L28